MTRLNMARQLTASLSKRVPMRRHALRQPAHGSMIVPRCPGAQIPEDAVEHLPRIAELAAGHGRACGQERLDQFPLFLDDLMPPNHADLHAGCTGGRLFNVFSDRTRVSMMIIP